MKRLFPIAFISILSISIASLSAQTETEEEDEDVFVLNPFEVDESEDLGYTAINTLSGTRFNTSLRDTAASVSVWTEEFLDDTGLTDIEELIDYSLSTVLDTADQDGAGGNFNVFTNATAVTRRIRTRGIESTQAIDYFKSIIPDDSYKIARYDDSRGPNGVLFGVSNAGGIINQSSLVANTYQDSGRFRYSVGTASRDRAEFRFNKVLIEDKLAVVFAGLNQDNSHWRDWASQDKERVFAALTYRPNDRLTLRANYEDGWEHRTSIQPSMITDRGLPWYDYSLVTPLEDITFSPFRGNGTGARVTNATRAVGVIGRDGNPRGFSGTGANRFTFIENDGTFHNLAGNFVTGGYNDLRVVPVDGSPGIPEGATPSPPRAFRINDTRILPYHYNVGGPDMYRETDFSLYSFFADWQITDNWFFNLQFGNQQSDVDVPQIQGTRPELRWDPNTVQNAVQRNAPPNPWVGRPYFDGDYRRDKNISTLNELRVSTSYNLETDNFGIHRLAVASSRIDETQRRGNTWLALGGNPDGAGSYLDFYGNTYSRANYLAADNRITIRNYFDWEDSYTWKAGTWRSLPETLSTDRWTPGVMTEYPVVWAEQVPGNINFLIEQVSESNMAVSQSFFFDNKLVVILGWRNDTVVIDRAGHYRDPVVGWIPDLDITPESTSTEDIIPAPPQANFEGTVRTAGAVYHFTDNISLVANTASNIGIPDYRRTVYPEGATSPPPQGDGMDLGIDFSLFKNRLNGRLVYYETDEFEAVVGGNNSAVRAERMYLSLLDAFTPAVDENGNTIPGTGNATALDDLNSRRSELRPEVNGRFRDQVANGFELRLTANITDSWRLQLNATKVDRIASNSYSRTIAFLGLKRGDDGLLIQGVSQGGEIPDPEDPEESTIITYNIDRSAYTEDGVISKLMAYESQLGEGQTFDTITDNGTRSFAFSLFEAVDLANDTIEQAEKRWGLRPYRFNVFTGYDFRGSLRGWSVGGGYRWQSANIIGEEGGVEFEGEPRTDADFYLRYRTARGEKFFGDGRWTFQMNVSNVLDNQTIIPSRLAIDGNLEYQIPGGRGPAYARFDFPTPRSFRFTVTYDF